MSRIEVEFRTSDPVLADALTTIRSFGEYSGRRPTRGGVVTRYYEDESVTLWHGDALDVLRQLPDGSVNCCVTSPPYYALRDYGVPGQYGLESSPGEYVETMRQVFAEVRQVLADDGTLWLNIGDSYYSGRGNPGPNAGDRKQPARRGWVRPVDRPAQDWSTPKNLLGIPWRVAFALQDDGWILRNAIVWNKPNAMPESVTDRLSCRYEHLFLFSKSRRYWFDLDAIREPLAYPEALGGMGATARRRGSNVYGPSAKYRPENAGTYREADGQQHRGGHENGRNPGDVWTVPTQPFSEAHFACMPVALAERCVQAGCKPSGVVLDPFSGSGTTGLAATKHGRRYVGIDLNADYLDLSLRTRLAQTALIDGTEAAS